MKPESISDVTGGWLRLLVVPLHFAGDVCRQDRLQPRGGAAANDPSVSRGYRASKAGGKSGGTQGKAFVPGHAWRITRQRKNAMRKNKACDPIRNAYLNGMSATLQAPQGGELHNLSDKFYLGGQFMPEQDVMAGAKRKASKAAAKFEIFGNPSIGMELRGQLPVSVEVAGRRKVIAWASNQEEAEAMRDTLRNVIETRLGGKALNWNS